MRSASLEKLQGILINSSSTQQKLESEWDKESKLNEWDKESKLNEWDKESKLNE